MLSQIMTKISGGVTFLGGVLIVFGLVNLGGGIVIAASVFLGNLDTSFAG